MREVNGDFSQQVWDKRKANNKDEDINPTLNYININESFYNYNHSWSWRGREKLVIDIYSVKLCSEQDQIKKRKGRKIYYIIYLIIKFSLGR